MVHFSKVQAQVRYKGINEAFEDELEFLMSKYGMNRVIGNIDLSTKTRDLIFFRDEGKTVCQEKNGHSTQKSKT